MNANKEKIITTAIALFKKNGYTETSVNEICSCCKLTKGTFYYHFNSKGEIFSNYWNDIINNINTIFPTLMTISSAKEKLWKIFEYVIDQITSLTKSFVKELLILGSQNRNTNPNNINLLEFEISPNSDWRIVTVYNLVIEGQKENTINPTKDPKLLLQSYGFSILGVGLNWSTNGNFDLKEKLYNVFNITFC
ncbi:MAG: TetR/AcrR family transcriptional regulator [Sarcina sp.]